MSRISEFLAWLKAQEGSAYVWGAEGEAVTGDGTVQLDGKTVAADWRAWVAGAERDAANAERASAFIENRLAHGAVELRCYDCSGLIMRYLHGIMSFLPRDLTANGLMGECAATKRGELVPGDLVFRTDAKRAYHVGVYMGEDFVAEAAGRDAGVVIRDINAAGRGYWNAYGALAVLEERNAPCAAQARFAECRGGSVNVRSGAGTDHRILAVAHKGDLMIAVPGETPGWADVAVYAGDRFVTGNMNEDYIQYWGE